MVSQMSIRKSIIWPVAILAAVMLVIALIVGVVFNFSIQRQISAHEDLSEINLLISDVSTGILAAEHFVQSVLLGTTEVDPNDQLETFERFIADVNSDMFALLEREQNPELTDAVYELTALYGAWYRSTKPILLEGAPAAKEDLIESNRLLSETTETATRISSLARELTNTHIQSISVNNRRLSLLLLGTAGLLSALAIVYAINTARVLAVNLRSALSRIIQMSEDGEVGSPSKHENFEELLQAIQVLEQAMIEKRQMSYRLLDAKKKAEAATEAKSRFLATMTHELRTPISGVIGLTELLAETQIDTDQKFYLDAIHNSSEELLRIVNDLLDFSALDASEISLCSKAFGLRSLISSIANLLQPKAEKSQLELLIDIPAEVPEHFVGDPSRLRQILINLLGNALKFTQEGYVVIAVRYTEDKVHPLTISVQDTGIGIPEEQRGRVFEAFQQVQDDLNRSFEGTGLGLAIASKLVHMMDGKISLTSELGEGSTFTIALALRRVDSIVETGTTTIQGITRSNRVFFISRNPVARALFERDLAELASEVHTTDSLADVLDPAVAPADLMVLDYPLAAGTTAEDACEILSRIWSHSALRHTPIIVASELQFMAELSKLDKHGPVCIIPKPIRSEILQQEINNLLQPSRKVSVSSGHANDQSVGIRYSGAVPRILIADDNKANQLILRKLLEPTQAALHFCGDGEQAVEAFSNAAFDLVLMDMSMPLLDGLGATHQIRAFEAEHALKECPIIAITANASNSDHERCIEAGMSSALTKPIKKQELFDMLNLWIRLHRPQ